MEELVAELGAAFLGADLEITPQPSPNHAAYIEAYLKVRDPKDQFAVIAHSECPALVQPQRGLDVAYEPKRFLPRGFLGRVLNLVREQGRVCDRKGERSHWLATRKET